MSESKEHIKLVQKIAEYAKSKGYILKCAKSIGLDECPATNEGHVPDLKAYNHTEEVWLYGEAKTADDIDNDHTREQINDFSGRTMTDNKKLVPFILAIPTGSKTTAQRVITSMNLTENQRKSIQIQEYDV